MPSPKKSKSIAEKIKEMLGIHTGNKVAPNLVTKHREEVAGLRKSTKKKKKKIKKKSQFKDTNPFGKGGSALPPKKKKKKVKQAPIPEFYRK